MRWILIGPYQVSVALIALLGVALVAAALTYMWATKTIPVSVEEPLSITDSPGSIRVHPGENVTIPITIVNAAYVNYSVFLTFTLNDTTFEQQYVIFSNLTYNIVPNTNQIEAWMTVGKGAPPSWVDLVIAFYRE